MRDNKPCPLAGKCGGCQLQDLRYSEQLDEKMDFCERTLDYWAPVAPILGMENPVHYRNKAQAVFGMQRGIVSGIYRKGTHYIVPVRDCMLEDSDADKIFQTVRKLMRKFAIMPYNEDMHDGVIRHVLVRKAVATGQILVVIVIGSSELRNKHQFASLIRQMHPNVETVLLNVNGEHTSMVLGDGPDQILIGKGYIEDVLCGLRFRISAKSFYQVNHSQAEVMYEVAMKMAQLKPTDVVLDAYCGTGTIGLVAASRGIEKLIGIEINPSAVEDARVNAQLNEIENAEFIEADASSYCKQMAKDKKKVNVLFMDPPRSGSDERFLSSAIKMGPDRIVYISCNIETLDRDLRYLTRFGEYEVIGFQPVDMFPYTTHVETIALLQKNVIEDNLVD